MTEQPLDLADDPWLTLAEIAEELRVNPATVRLWVSKGQLKASRAGVRKWIVRRSDLDEMLVGANAGGEHGRTEPNTGGSAHEGGSPDSGEQTSAAPRFLPPVGTRESVTELMHQANRGLDAAFAACVLAPPAAGYVGRIRALADSCEHMAATWIHAARTAGLSWKGRGDFSPDRWPYELRAGGNRPRVAGLWDEFDEATEALGVTMKGRDLTAVGEGFREVGNALMSVARKLELEHGQSRSSHTG